MILLYYSLVPRPLPCFQCQLYTCREVAWGQGYSYILSLYAVLMICYISLQVKFCPVCQQMNKRLNLEHPELHPVLVKSLVYHIGIDFVGSVSPIFCSVNRYILTVRLLHQVWMGKGITHEGGKKYSFCTQEGKQTQSYNMSALHLKCVYLSHAAIFHHQESTKHSPYACFS